MVIIDTLIIKAKLKKELIDNFNLIQSNIEQSCKIIIQPEMYAKYLDLKDKFIEKCEKIFNENIQEINKHIYTIKDLDESEETIKENIKTNSFQSDFIFFGPEFLQKSYKDHDPIGVLVVSDFYLNDYFKSFLRYGTFEKKLFFYLNLTHYITKK